MSSRLRCFTLQSCLDAIFGREAPDSLPRLQDDRSQLFHQIAACFGSRHNLIHAWLEHNHIFAHHTAIGTVGGQIVAFAAFTLRGPHDPIPNIVAIGSRGLGDLDSEFLQRVTKRARRLAEHRIDPLLLEHGAVQSNIFLLPGQRGWLRLVKGRGWDNVSKSSVNWRPDYQVQGLLCRRSHCATLEF